MYHIDISVKSRCLYAAENSSNIAHCSTVLYKRVNKYVPAMCVQLAHFI